MSSYFQTLRGGAASLKPDEAKAALALQREFLPFSAGSFGLNDHVTFAVRRGRAGLEAVDLVAQRCEVRGLASPHSILDAVRWEICTFFKLRATGSSCSMSWCPLR